MTNANYKRGYRAELQAKKILEGYGYTVLRSAKSGGPFDIVGFKKEGIIAVQVKACPIGVVPSYPRVRKEIENVPTPTNCKKELWIKESRKGWHYFPL